MDARSSLSEAQRGAAVAWFEQGFGDSAVSTLLGAPRWPVRRLYQRWRLRGRGALVAKKSVKPSYSFEFKLALVQRFLAGEGAMALAEEAQLSSPALLKTWARAYRRDGEDALRPRPKGRPPAPASAGESELDRLRRENEFLRAQNAYLGKLRALMEQQRRSR